MNYFGVTLKDLEDIQIALAIDHGVVACFNLDGDNQEITATEDLSDGVGL